jgi:hypothetical protein
MEALGSLRNARTTQLPMAATGRAKSHTDADQTGNKNIVWHERLPDSERLDFTAGQ